MGPNRCFAWPTGGPGAQTWPLVRRSVRPSARPHRDGRCVPAASRARAHLAVSLGQMLHVVSSGEPQHDDHRVFDEVDPLGEAFRLIQRTVPAAKRHVGEAHRGHALTRLDECDVRPWLHFAQLLSEVGIALGQRAKVAPKGRRCNDGLRHLICASALLGLKHEHEALGLSEHSKVRLEQCPSRRRSD